MRILIIILLLTITCGTIYSQVDIIIDPIYTHCYRIKDADSLKLRIKLKDYQGRIIVNAKYDTVLNNLAKREIVFVKLRSNNNPNDSIEIRLDQKWGKSKIVEKKEKKILSLLDSITVEKTGYDGCIMPMFSIIVKVDEKK